MAGHWALPDIPWRDFDPARVDPEILRVVQAAALVEANAADYVTYLHNIFAADPGMCAAIDVWGREEAQHGAALGRWAELADPGFRFAARLAQFQAGYRIPVDATASVRGSRSGEMIARCVVECGTSSFYRAIRDATREPVLRRICGLIAADEFRHYKLFLNGYRRYGAMEPLTLPRRIRIALGRILEADDDELAFAWHCGTADEAPYDRRRAARAYALRAGRLYRYGHVAHALTMVLKACGMRPRGRWVDPLCRLAWSLLRARTTYLGWVGA